MIDRVEVMDQEGRQYVKGSIYGTPVKVELSIQDGGRTLKVFVTPREVESMSKNTIDTNQASEDELRAEILTEFKQVHKLAPADYTENCTNVVMSIIRTEKLKLLAEVREQTTIFKIKAHDKKGQPHLYEAGRGVPTEALTKLEAEL